jgi:hypothetical protein
MTMHSETMTAIRVLDAGEIDAVCGGATGETFSNHGGPGETVSNNRSSIGESRMNLSVPTFSEGGCSAHESAGTAIGYCSRE